MVFSLDGPGRVNIYYFRKVPESCKGCEHIFTRIVPPRIEICNKRTAIPDECPDSTHMNYSFQRQNKTRKFFCSWNKLINHMEA